MASTTPIILLAVFFMYAICQVSSANMLPSDCCLTTKDKEIPYNNVKCYKQQATAMGCNIDAIIFVTRRNKHLCAPPGSKWVTELMVKLDKHKKHFKKDCRS